MPANLRAFGNAVRQLRKAKGLTQKEVVERIPRRYTDMSSLSRVERGGRQPSRDAVIDLLIKGLGETDVPRIDAVLKLGGYEGLSEIEIEKQGLTSQPERPSADTEFPLVEHVPPLSRRTQLVYGTLVLASIGAGAAAAFRAGAPPMWFVLVTSVLYAGLFAVSLFLETAYEDHPQRTAFIAVSTFCFIFLTSVGTLAIDSQIVRAGGSSGLWISLAVFFLAAIAQWVATRLALPAHEIVLATFRVHTAQAAHFKNTAYFLSIVLLFWLPPTHCVLTLDHQVAGGHADLARRAMDTSLFAGGAICPRPGWLWLVLAVILVGSFPMGARLLENLTSDRHLNRFQNLFYTRALLYFSLSIVCLLWYSFRFAAHATP